MAILRPMGTIIPSALEHEVIVITDDSDFDSDPEEGTGFHSDDDVHDNAKPLRDTTPDDYAGVANHCDAEDGRSSHRAKTEDRHAAFTPSATPERASDLDNNQEPDDPPERGYGADVVATTPDIGRLLDEVALLRETIKRIEAKLGIASRTTIHQRKRKRRAPEPRSKKRCKVNIAATRAWLQDTEEGCLEYAWKRGGGGGFSWIRELGRGKREEVAAEVLLAYSGDLLSIELRQNGDGIPVTVR
ncbi:hypothetical protein SODALDRAFT_323700 [Sodiomyces alkalinus F11]|uniref:Uncharacterized protein n=1 Tax=Sodiomyces alkalinus (strain CBS 110278 / VKM F-3762 / F11) TaxID=1314773 RepID=A0A3N2PXN5_SODAK|nr:hypothetical protein SODALDRAFT_323700 [Sodiomyces alkalinus F11]ROT39293.1 hypothetical protein SODALDRAFT_323700 [Sodiomyces alkalinus F11]